jgi:GNAT superfamily N-acetyltransferase
MPQLRDPLDIRRVGYADADAKALTRASVAEIDAHHGGVPGSGGEPGAAQFEPPDGVFLVAYLEDDPVACGGLTRYDEDTAEIKRMYVAPHARGRGLSRRVLAALEDEARERGFRAVRLETGNRQTEALGLYRSAGYAEIPKYGPFVDDERSICFERDL